MRSAALGGTWAFAPGAGTGVHTANHLVATVLWALASAAAYGLAAVLQHHRATQEPPELSMRPQLLVNLARHPVWLLANGLDVVGYLLQFVALRYGSLVLVEPLLVLSLVFALPVAARLEHRRISLNEGLSVGLVTGGLALFLVVARPGLGHSHAPAEAWLALTIATGLLCGALAVIAGRGTPRRAALLFGIGSGVAFGYVAAVTKRAGQLLDGGILHLLTTWTPYALVAAAAAALLLTQSAFHAGPLRLSLPALTVAQPLVAVAIGVAVFDEHITTGPLAVPAEVVGLVVTTIGVFALGRSPIIALEHEA